MSSCSESCECSNKKIGGPDASFSLDKIEFAKMVNAVREAESALGKVTYDLTERQIKGKGFSRSLYAINDISKGDIFDTSNIRSIRPGFGLHPKFLDQVLGKKSKMDIKRGSRILKSMF